VLFVAFWVGVGCLEVGELLEEGGGVWLLGFELFCV
jgi:hypothetical protein